MSAAVSFKKSVAETVGKGILYWENKTLSTSHSAIVSEKKTQWRL